MIAVAVRRLHELAAAQDVVHQSILKIICNLDHINEKDPLATEGYLCATVRHLAIDVQRRLRVSSDVHRFAERHLQDGLPAEIRRRPH